MLDPDSDQSGSTTLAGLRIWVLIGSVVDPKLIVTDPTFQRVSDPDPAFKSSGSGFGYDTKYLLFLQNYDFTVKVFQ
jgi:hypothetical protein